MRLANFVIGGTEKAGTTSVFDYLSRHPQVCASARKETDFFRDGLSGDSAADVARYGAFFDQGRADARVFMEASPGYLGEAVLVAPRMSALIPEAKILFILRDPIDRLYSSYHFHRGRLNLPADMDFEDYVRRSMDYDAGRRSAHDLGLDDWYLKVLRFGCYAQCLQVYEEYFPRSQVKVMFFEFLRDEPLAFMCALSEFLGIDAGFWPTYQFRPSNVTFSGRSQVLHRFAVQANLRSEPFFRRYPGLKRAVVGAYKAVNQARQGYDPMSAAVRSRLVDYYAADVQALRARHGLELPASWRYLVPGAPAS